MTLILGSSTVNEYIKSFEDIKSKNTARVYKSRLAYFNQFIRESYNLSLDELIITLTQQSHGPKIDIYSLLSSFVSYSQNNKASISPITLKHLLSTVRNYLETFGVELSPRRYKLKVKTPRVIRASKEALTKEDIRILLNACSNSLKLRTYVHLLAATGCRATEALSIKISDINFSKNPVTIFIHGEHTKTKADRIIMVTSELVDQIKAWIDYKHRTRRIHYYNKKTGESRNEIRTPAINKDLYLFALNHKQNPDLKSLYCNLVWSFEDVLDRLGGKYAEWENSHKRRRKITLHSFRRWVFSCISDLGYSQYAEEYIGHATVSTYYRRSETEKIALFKRIEPYLIFMDQAGLERKGADLESKLDSVVQENRELRENINKIMEMIQENPKFAYVKPEVLVKKRKKLERK